MLGHVCHSVTLKHRLAILEETFKKHRVKQRSLNKNLINLGEDC